MWEALMKVLVASLPADGHFDPLTGIAAHLSQVGHDVRWYAGPAYGRKLDELDMMWFPYERATELTGGNLNEHFPERARLRGRKLISFDLEKFFVSNVEAHYLDLVDVRREFDFDVFFCDGAMYAAKLVADVLHVPVLSVALSTIVPDDNGPPPFFGLRPARHVLDRVKHHVVRRMLASTMKAGVHTYNEVLSRYGVAPIPPNGFPHVPLASADRVLLNGCPGMDFPGYRPPDNAEFVGALVPARPVRAPQPLPGEVVHASGRPVVVVSQGTVDNTDPTKLVVPTLEALAGGPHLVVATTGSSSQIEDLRQRFPASNVIVEDYIDYDQLFPYTDVFVTNGGLGSVMAAMRHGVPVVGAGKTEGKNDVDARIGHNGLGVDLRTERPKPAALRAAVEVVLADAGIRTRVCALQAELASYDPRSRVDAVLEELVTGDRRSGRR